MQTAGLKQQMALDGVTVHGVLTHTITVFERDAGPV